MLIHYEHGDLYGTSFAALLARAAYTQLSSAPLFSTIARNGTYSLQYDNSNRGSLRWNLPAPLTVVGSGVALYLGAPADSTAAQGLRFDLVGGGVIRVLPNSTGGVTVYNGGTAVGSSASGLWSTAAYFWMEARVTTGAGTAGAVQVRLNGNTTPILNLTGLTITNQVSGVRIGMEATAGQGNGRYDDWIVWDTTGTVNNDFMGDTFVIAVPPDADDATVNDFTTSSGSNKWTLVDELVPNDTDFIVANDVGDAQEFSHAPVNLPVGAVAAIATQVRALKTDAGASSIKTGIRSNGVVSMGNEVALATGASVSSHIHNLNPDGNVPWTQEAAQAAKPRLERAA